MMVARGQGGWTRVGIAGLLLLGILIFGRGVGRAQDPPAAPAAIEPPRALMEAKFQTLEGGRKRLVDFRGEILVVNLWATWCGPCRKEIPFLNELSAKLGPQGVRIIGLTTERPEEDRTRIEAFVDSLEIRYLIGFARGELMRYLMQGRNAIPQTYVFDRNGRLLRHFIGFNPGTSPLHLRAVIDQAMAATE
jgi:thiol-disulfide isomerase/thioredoxin